MGIGEIDSGARYICEGCSFAAKPRKALRGSPSLELVLWLALLVPGAIYAWWRYRGARLVCRCAEMPTSFAKTKPAVRRPQAGVRGEARPRSQVPAGIYKALVIAVSSRSYRATRGTAGFRTSLSMSV